MNYCGLNPYDTSNGPGIRVSLFVSGCRMHCKGCFNPESWDFKYGKKFEVDNEGRYIIALLSNPYIKGFSLLGGDPFEPEHKETLLNLLSCIKIYCPNKSIWVWTGRKYDQIKDSPILEFIDVLIDGPFIEHLKDPKLKYRGSSNQRILQLHPFKDITNEY